MKEVIIALSTIAFSGIVSAYIAHRLATNRADREFRLKRLEELFLSVTRFDVHYTTNFVPYLLVMRGQSTLDAAQSSINAQPPTEGGRELDNIEMIVRIYFPELRPYFEALVRIRDRVGHDYIAEMIARAGQGRAGQDLVGGFLNGLKSFHDSIEQLKARIFLIAEAIQGRSLSVRIRNLFRDQFG